MRKREAISSDSRNFGEEIGDGGLWRHSPLKKRKRGTTSSLGRAEKMERRKWLRNRGRLRSARCIESGDKRGGSQLSSQKFEFARAPIYVGSEKD